MAKDVAVWADHILDAIANIEADSAGHDLERFRGDRRARQLVERNLEIISEASRRLPRQLTADERDVDWSAIAGIGNILRHDYQKSDPKVLWETCQKNLGPLKSAVERIHRRIARLKQASRAVYPTSLIRILILSAATTPTGSTTTVVSSCSMTTGPLTRLPGPRSRRR